MRKIVILGITGFQLRTSELKIDCFQWSDAKPPLNLRDYDVLMIDLLGVKTEEWLPDHVFDILTPDVLMGVLHDNGSIVIMGDPRVTIGHDKGRSYSEKHQPFLWWTGINFLWNNDHGDTITINSKSNYKPYRQYLHEIDKWTYSLSNVAANTNRFITAMTERSLPLDYNIEIIKEDLATNRYGKSLAFALDIFIYKRMDGRSGARVRDEDIQALFDLSPLIFLPPSRLSEEESVARVLQDVFGVTLASDEPVWVQSIPAPGQSELDRQIEQLGRDIQELQVAMETVTTKRRQTRKVLRLLYEGGDALERVVRDALRFLGATVDEPTTPGQEDGWLRVEIDDILYEGVMEIKSKKRGQMDKDGLRQLFEWRDRGLLDHQKEYKGIFIANNSFDRPPEERPDPFSSEWVQSAAMSRVIAITTVTLYDAYVLHAAGRLDTRDFWQRLFAGDGVFDGSEYREEVQRLTDQGLGDERAVPGAG